MPIFSEKEIQKHVEKVEQQGGTTLEVGVESDEGQLPSLVIEAQGEHDGERVDVTWAAWAKTQLTKATTAIGAKVGFKW